MRKKKESIYITWDEVDNALRKIGELEIKKNRIEGLQTLMINKLKERYSKKGKEITSEISSLKKEVTRFCEQNKDSFLSKRTKKLNFGSLSYRINKKVVYACEESVIKALLSLNLDFCLRVKKEVEKDKLKELDANTLTKIGVQIVKEDKLTIEPNIVKIAANYK